MENTGILIFLGIIGAIVYYVSTYGDMQRDLPIALISLFAGMVLTASFI